MKKNVFRLCFCCLLWAMLLGGCAGTGGGSQGQGETAGETQDRRSDESQEEIYADAEMTWQDYYDLGVRYLNDGNYQEAIIAFTAAIEIDPKRAAAYAGRGDAYIGSGETVGNLEAALADYGLAAELDGAEARAYLGLADVYIRQGEYDKALEILRQGLEKTGGDSGIAEKIAEIEEGKFSDSSGRNRRRNYFDAGGNLEFYHIIQYDDSGKLSRLDAFMADGTVMGYTLYRRSEDGTHQYSDEYDMDGNWLESSLRVEDADGKWLYTTGLDENGVEKGFRSVAQYDEDGRLIGWDTVNDDGSLNGYARYEGEKIVYYDAEGNVMSYAE